jgi:hypothetical protein
MRGSIKGVVTQMEYTSIGRDVLELTLKVTVEKGSAALTDGEFRRGGEIIDLNFLGSVDQSPLEVSPHPPRKKAARVSKHAPTQEEVSDDRRGSW